MKSNRKDSIIITCVMLTTIMSLAQNVLIGVFHVPEDVSTTYRVFLSAIPMLIAICYSLSRGLGKWIVAYSISILLLLLTCIFFPQNQEYLIHDSLRFTLPMVLGSCLAICSIHDFSLIKQALYATSWIAVGLAIVYSVSILEGRFIIENYNMSFSYGLLLPMMSLYRDKRWYSILGALFIAVLIMAIGSRGALVTFFIYVFFELLFQRRKGVGLFVILSLSFVLILFIPYLEEIMSAIGVSSRTISLIQSNDLFYGSHREDVYSKTIEMITNAGVLGYGLYGDRIVFNGAYCHNFFLEVLFDFGIVPGILILLLFFSFILYVFFKSDRNNRIDIIFWIIAAMVPLMISSSYLIDSSFGIMMGVLVLMKKKLVS